MKSNHLRCSAVVITILATILTLLTTNLSFAETDVTDMIEINKSRMRMDRRTGENYIDASVSNISENALLAPLKVVIDSISNSSVTVANADGYTNEGKPYFLYSTHDDLLHSDESTSISRWLFSNPKRARFTFAVFVYEGTAGEMRSVSTSEIIIDFDTGTHYVIGQILLMPISDTSRLEVEQLVSSLGGSVIGYLKYVNLYQILFSNSTLSELKAIVGQLNQDERIQASKINTVTQVNSPPSDPWNEKDDPSDKETWDNVPSGNNAAMESMRFPEVWEEVYPNNTVPGDIPTVNIGIIDSDFPADIHNFLDDSYICTNHHDDLAFTWVNQSGESYEHEKDSGEKKNYQHGHHVAGIIGATPNNSIDTRDIGITGAVWGAKLYGYRLGKYLPESDVLEAVVKLIMEREVEIVNMSLGRKDLFKDISTNSEKLKLARDEIKFSEAFFGSLINTGKDFLIVQAAGNDGVDAVANGYACSVMDVDIKKHLLCVGSYGTDVPLFDDSPEYHFARNSNHGPLVDILGPGDTFSSTLFDGSNSVYSTVYNYDDNSSKYTKKNGTSIAAPHITGLAGLLKQKFHGLSYPQIRKAILRVNEDDDPILEAELFNGNKQIKVVNAWAAYQVALGKESSQLNDASSPVTGFMAYYDASPNIHANRLIWNRSTDAVTYKIYWGNDDSVNRINNAGVLQTTSTEFLHSFLEKDKSYYYRISFIDNNGNESALSYQVYTYTPTTHTNAVAIYVPKKYSNMLYWYSADTSLTYRIYWGYHEYVDNVTYEDVLQTTDTEYRHITISPNKTYYYKFYYVDVSGNEIAFEGPIQVDVPKDHIVWASDEGSDAAELQWQLLTETEAINVNWYEAEDYCLNLFLGGYDDWRLPTIDELREAYQLTDFPIAQFPSYEQSLWSSTEVESNPLNAYVIYGNEDWAWANQEKEVSDEYSSLLDGTAQCVRNDGIGDNCESSSPGTWNERAEFAGTSQREALSFSIGDKGYVGITREYPTEFWEYSTVTDTWTQKADLPPGSGFQEPSFVVNGKGYIVMGTAVWQYDPEMDQWTPKNDIPGEDKRGAFGFSIGNKAYVGGGYYNLGYLYEYDPEMDQWTEKNQIPMFKPYANGTAQYATGDVSFTIGAKAYITGTNMGVWEYDPSTDTWEEKLPYSPYTYSTAYSNAFSINDRGYIFNAHGEILEFNPFSNSIEEKTHFIGTPVCYPVAFTINGTGYIGLGGVFENNTCTLTTGNAFYEFLIINDCPLIEP